MIQATGTLRVDIGVASRARSGQEDSGDLSAVLDRRSGVLIAVVDGLGHGAPAAAAARAAIAAIRSTPDEAIVPLVRNCHRELRRTRGATMSLVEIDFRANTLTWLSVGNVEAILLRAHAGLLPASERILQRGGVVGDRLPPLQTTVLPLSAGDTLIMTTDGIAEDFTRDLRVTGHPQELAERICTRFSRADDDALALVARLEGTQS